MMNRFKELATFRGRGGVLKELIGPGPPGGSRRSRQAAVGFGAAGSERLYRSYIYIGNTLDIVAIDPESGAHTVFTSPVKSEPGAWAMAAGPDGKIYVGTLPHAHVLRLDPATGAFTDMGRPSETEEYIWQLALGSDRRLYGCTYPNCKLVRFDPATGRGEDLGRMDPQEQYARSVAASDDGFVYVGIGTTRMHLVAYEIRTGEHRDLLPAALRTTGTAGVVRGDDGTVYATAGSRHFRLRGWEATPIDAGEYRPGGALRLRDGRLVAMEGTTLRVTHPATHEAKTYPVAYEGKETNIFRIGRGPDGMLYGSSMMPIHFFRVDPKGGKLTVLGELGGGEYYSFLRHGDTLLGAAYSGRAPLMIYRPEKPFHPGPEASDNPRLVHFEGEDSGWRPQAMIAGPGDKVYLGAVSGYGKLGGPLAVFDPETRAVETFPHVVKDQSVVSLAVAGGLIVGGTTIDGGGGSFPTATEATLFLWDPVTKKKVFETVPVPGARGITCLATGRRGDGATGRADSDAYVFGIAGGKELFVFDVRARRVLHRGALPFSGVIYNAMAAGPDGRLYGLCAEGVFVVDPRSYEARLEAGYPERLTAGFALDGDTLYFVAGARVVSYALAAPG